MFDGKPRVARFLDVRAIRAIALISISFTFLIVVAPPRRTINAAPAPQPDPTRNQLSQSQQSQTKSGEREQHQASEQREPQAGAAVSALRLEDLERMALLRGSRVTYERSWTFGRTPLSYRALCSPERSTPRAERARQERRRFKAISVEASFADRNFYQ